MMLIAKRLIQALLLFLIIAACAAPALACTVFAASDGKTTLAGNNEDWEDKDTFLWFLPASEGKFARVFYGFENAHPQGGMNEKGLFFDWFASGGDLAPDMPSKQKYSGDLSDLLLETCATVDEALAFYGQHNEPAFGYAAILLADSAGNMATAKWDWDKNELKVTRINGGHMQIGVGAVAVSQKLNKPDALTAGVFCDALDAAHNDRTLYSTVCDLNNRKLTVYNRHHFDRSVEFDLATQWAKGPRMVSIPSLFPDQAKGTENFFSPWSLRTQSQNIVFAALGILYALAVTGFVLALALGRPKGLGIALPSAALAGSAGMLAIVLLLHFRLYFIFKYGMAVLGPIAAALPWVTVLICAVLLALVLIAWAKRLNRLPVRIAASVLAVLTPALLWYTTTLGVFMG